MPGNNQPPPTNTFEYAIFMDHGYRGLYGGMGMRDIRERKRLKPNQHVLDHMGSTELAANLFRATQTEEKLRRENVRKKDQANRVHSEVGRKVRRTICELGGTMPENLPVAESIKKVETREKKASNRRRHRNLNQVDKTSNMCYYSSTPDYLGSHCSLKFE